MQLVINEHLTSQTYHTHIPTSYEPLHVLRSTRTEIVNFETQFATLLYLSNNFFLFFGIDWSIGWFGPSIAL